MRKAPALTLMCLAAALFFMGASAKAAQRTIYLTFDDGPLPGTETILQVLSDEAIPATLFMVGSHAELSAERRALVVKAKSLPLVTVGNHSYSHANNHYRHFYSDTDQVLEDLARADTVLGLKGPPIYARLPGRDVFRLPNISRNDVAIRADEEDREMVSFEFVSAYGYYLYGWDHEWVHYNDGKPVQTVDHLVSEIDHLFGYGRLVKKNKLVLLMHDQMFQDAFQGESNLRTLIRLLRQRGYAFGDIKTYDDD